jgi:hypothetical protein
VFQINSDLTKAFDNCKDFSVTAVVRALKLKSNPVSYNDYKGPKGGSDPFADHDAYEAQLKWERERRRKGP